MLWAWVMPGAMRMAEAGVPCNAPILASDGNGHCLSFDLSGLPMSTVTIDDAYPEPYLVGPPCDGSGAIISNCSACSATRTGHGVAYQVYE